jgi:hypothetical protein
VEKQAIDWNKFNICFKSLPVLFIFLFQSSVEKQAVCRLWIKFNICFNSLPVLFIFVFQSSVEKQAIDWIKWLVREEAYFESESGCAARKKNAFLFAFVFWFWFRSWLRFNTK